MTSDSPSPDTIPSDAFAAEPTWIRGIGLFLGPLLLVACLLSPRPEGWSPEAHRLSGVMALTICWWLTEPIPIPATGLAAAFLCVVVGAVPTATNGAPPAKVVLAPFADPSVFFLLGGMFLARAMTRHGLDRRLALAILASRWAGKSPGAILFAVGLAVTTVSMWISNTAATAMVYPVTMGMISVLASGSGQRDFARSRFASALLLSTAYSSSVGGIATPIGTATNVVAMGFFRRPDFFGQSIDFFRWVVVGLPMTFVLMLGLFFWLRTQASSRALDLPRLRQYLLAERLSLGPWKRGEQITLTVFLIVVALWVTPAGLSFGSRPEASQWFARHFPEEMVALLAPILLYLAPIDWRRGEFALAPMDFAKLDWGTMLLFGAGMSLGNLMFQTGLAERLGHAALEQLGTRDIWVITALGIAGGILLSEFTSNAATASTLIPVIWAICKAAEVNPIPPVFGVTFAASFGSALPVSTPPNAIVYGSGLVPMRRMVTAGIGLDLLCGVCIWTVLRVAWALGWNPIM